MTMTTVAPYVLFFEENVTDKYNVYIKKHSNNITFLIKPCFIIPNIRCRYTSQQTLFFDL